MIRKKQILPFLLKMDQNVHHGNPEIGDMYISYQNLIPNPHKYFCQMGSKSKEFSSPNSGDHE